MYRISLTGDLKSPDFGNKIQKIKFEIKILSDVAFRKFGHAHGVLWAAHLSCCVVKRKLPEKYQNLLRLAKGVWYWPCGSGSGQTGDRGHESAGKYTVPWVYHERAVSVLWA